MTRTQSHVIVIMNSKKTWDGWAWHRRTGRRQIERQRGRQTEVLIFARLHKPKQRTMIMIIMINFDIYINFYLKKFYLPLLVMFFRLIRKEKKYNSSCSFFEPVTLTKPLVKYVDIFSYFTRRVSWHVIKSYWHIVFPLISTAPSGIHIEITASF